MSPGAGDFGQIVFPLWIAVSPLVIGGCGKGLGPWSPGLGTVLALPSLELRPWAGLCSWWTQVSHL